jgi:nucleotide-binding universal stress UspA family protein
MMDESSTPKSPFARILFYTDFSENADRAFDYAIDAVVRRPDCTLFLLHVIPEPEAQFWKTYIYEVDGVDEKAKADIDAKIAESYLPRVPRGVELKVEVRVGRDELRILEFAREQAIDLIILGRRSSTAFEKMLFGGVTEKVARKAPCPVLVIPSRPGKMARR